MQPMMQARKNPVNEVLPASVQSAIAPAISENRFASDRQAAADPLPVLNNDNPELEIANPGNVELSFDESAERAGAVSLQK